jgi:hypothetical protein
MALNEGEQIAFEKQVILLVNACEQKLRALGLPWVTVVVVDNRSGRALNLAQLVQMANGTLPDPTPPRPTLPEWDQKGQGAGQ